MNNDILMTTLWIFGGLFIAALLIIVFSGNKSWGRNIKVAVISWMTIAALFLVTSYFGMYTFGALTLLISYGAIREFYTLNKVYSKTLMGVTAVALLGMAGIIAFSPTLTPFYYFPGLLILILAPLQMFRGKTDDFIATTAKQYMGLIYWGWLFLHFLLMIRLPAGFGLIISLCTMIAVNDNSAYFVGILLGKNSKKFAPNISPNKTWTGFWGGFVATIITACAFGYALPELVLWKRVIFGVVTASVIPIGDLMESAMKRDLNVKDSGTIIPGHGGVMDRFDSWTVTVPIVYYLYLILTGI